MTHATRSITQPELDVIDAWLAVRVERAKENTLVHALFADYWRWCIARQHQPTSYWHVMRVLLQRFGAARTTEPYAWVRGVRLAP